MANQEHVHILEQGAEAWNTWREEHPEIIPDLAEVDFYAHEELIGANFKQANLHRAFFDETDLRAACFIGANLREANFSRARLEGANMCNADLEKADLSGAELDEALFDGARLVATNFQYANLRSVSLTNAHLMKTNFRNANLTGCHVYGVSLWNIDVEGAIQRDLVITEEHEPTITVDNFEVALLVSLLLRRRTVRDSFEISGKKLVLILGNLSANRNAFLAPLRNALFRHNLYSLTLDVGPSGAEDATVTIETLAHLARFIIADLTNTEDLSQALHTLIPRFPSIPVQPIIQANIVEDALFESFEQYPSVLPILFYQDIPEVLVAIDERFIVPIEGEN
jgi:hypothetical protein